MTGSARSWCARALWLAGQLAEFSHSAALFSVAIVVNDAWVVPFAYSLVSFPSRRPRSRGDRLPVAAYAVAVFPLQMGFLRSSTRLGTRFRPGTTPVSPTRSIWAQRVIVTGAALAGAPWLGGRVVRRHRDAAQRLAAVAEELRRERDEHERLAVLAERTRIAAELNDAVAHALAEILMQAGAASNAIANDPETATIALRAIQERGRAAALELRRMLVLMRASPSRETPSSSTATPEGTITRTSPNTAIAVRPSCPPSASA